MCAAGSRLLVDKSIKNEFVDKLAARTKKMVAGDPMDPKTRFGALSSKKQMETVLRYIASGKKEGAALVAGGERIDIGTGKGYPCAADGVCRRETRDDDFARGDLRLVLATIEFADLDEAIARANDSPYGLAAEIWTKDVKKAHYVAKQLQAGTVWINTYNIYDTATPSAATSSRASAVRMSMHAIEHYTQLKSVWVDLNL